MLRVLSRTHGNAEQWVQPLSMIRFSSNKSVEPVASQPAAPAAAPAAEPEHSIHRRMYNVSNFDKKLLVWVGRYKTAEEIPKQVPVETIERAKNKGRIKVSNYMILGTILGCGVMVYLGKAAAGRGESVQQMNLDWHKAVKEGKA